jgi:hypothetical protein
MDGQKMGTYIRHEDKTVQKQQMCEKTVNQGGITKMDEIKQQMEMPEKIKV